MSLFIKKAKFKSGKVYISIVDGFRLNGKVKQKIIQKYGYLEDLKKIHDDIDNFLIQINLMILKMILLILVMPT